MANAFNIASRLFPAGTFTSPSFQIPANVTTVKISFTILSTDVTDTTKTMTFAFNRSDGLGGWIFDNGFEWQGGPALRNGLPRNPSVSIDVGPLQGQTCQVVLTLNKSLTAAISVDAV